MTSSQDLIIPNYWEGYIHVGVGSGEEERELCGLRVHQIQILVLLVES